MKKKDDAARIGHIFEALCRVEEYTLGVDKNTFLGYGMMQDAVMRQIEIIGEASRNISDEFQEAHPDLPWPQMRGIRNKIVHDYLEINTDIIWDTIQNDLPALKVQIQKLVE